MFESEKEKLLKTLYNKGIENKAVLKAMFYVDRHKFVPEALFHKAYEDFALPIGNGQTISQPATVAIMSSLIEASEGQKVLEIGTGSGYQAAVLFQMKLRVYSIERNYDLFTSAKKRLEELGYGVNLRFGDGTIGWTEFAPYDAIIVTASGPGIPSALVNQLKIGGRLVIPTGTGKEQNLVLVKKISEDKIETKEIPDFKFVPLIGKLGWKKE